MPEASADCRVVQRGATGRLGWSEMGGEVIEMDAPGVGAVMGGWVETVRAVEDR